jgi:hypothetical protein
MGMPGLRTVYVASLVAALCGCRGTTDQYASPFGQTGSGPGVLTGAAGGVAPGVPGAGTGAPSAAGNAAPGTPGAAMACDSGRLGARAVMFTPRQYVNVLRDLMGPTAVSEQDANNNSEFSFDTVDRPQMTTAMLDRLVRLAETATNTLKGKTPATLGCTASTDVVCVRKGLEKLAHRAWKRPVEPAELDGLLAIHAMGMTAAPDDAGETGALFAMQAVLTAPSALYRTEFSAPVAAMTRTLTAHERAAGLASLLLDSIPDEPLLAAADDGSLLTDAGLSQQIDRLLLLPRVREHVTGTVLSSFHVPRVFTTPKDAKLFPEYDGMLQNSMFEETRRFVEDVLWTRNAPVGELLTSRRSFIDGPLAKLYGMPAPATPFAATMMPPERAGILSQASVLTVLGRPDKTSVVARGLFIRGNVLCQPKIPGPPSSVAAQVAAQVTATATQKDLAAYRAMTSPCMTCHAQFDRLGLMLEGFDSIGRADPANAEAIDFAGLEPLNTVVEDFGEFTTIIEETQSFEKCFADRTFGYALTSASDSNQFCLGNLRDPAKLANATIRDVILAIATSPAFSTRTGDL